MKQYFVKYKHTFIVWSLIFGFVTASFAPSIYEWNRRTDVKPIRHFELVHNFPTDFNFYVSRIRQGKEGAWLATEKYTSEPHAASLAQVLYVLIGRASDWAHVQTPYVWFSYHVARILFGILALYAIWRFVAFHGKGFSWQVLTFLVVVTASTWPKFEWVAGWPRFGAYMAWWTQVNELQRIAFLPHVLFGQAVMTFVLWVLAGGFITKKHPGNYVFLGIIGLALGIVFPPALLFSYVVIAVLTTGEVVGFGLSVFTAKKSAFKKSLAAWFSDSIIGRFIYGVISAPALIYYSLLFREYPWKRLVEYDVVNPPPFEFREYFLALGPTLPLGILGGIVLLLHLRNASARRFKVALAWVTAWLLMLLIFSHIPQQSPMRFGQMTPHVPLGILTVYLFGIIASYLKKIKELKPIRFSVFFVPIFMVCIGLLNMFSSYMWLQDFVDHKLRADIPLVPKGASVMYPLRTLIDTYKWLEVYTPRDAVVLADETTSNYIPVYSGNTTFVGHANTVDHEIKLAATHNFYRKQFNNEIELGWIREKGIDFIIYGPEEKEHSGWIDDLREFYPQLEQVYENDYFKIYRLPLEADISVE